MRIYFADEEQVSAEILQIMSYHLDVGNLKSETILTKKI